MVRMKVEKNYSLKDTFFLQVDGVDRFIAGELGLDVEVKSAEKRVVQEIVDKINSKRDKVINLGRKQKGQVGPGLVEKKRKGWWDVIDPDKLRELLKIKGVL